jgi:hypothetical protein
MFSATGNKGFSITFENGNTVSVQWGPANYCDPTHKDGRNASFDAPMTTGAKGEPWNSETAEVAAWDSDGNWHNCGGDQVKGWLSPAEVVEFINFAASNSLNTSSPFGILDEDEDEDEDSNSGDASNYAAPI